MKIFITFFLMIWVTFSQAATSVTVIGNTDQPLEGVVVYATSVNTVISPKGFKKTVELHQTNKAFAPYITVIGQYQTVRFINDDNITHHVYSAMGPERFSFKLRKDSPSKNITFNNPGDVPMGCNIHDWMSGHILVLDTPYFGVTNAKGQVTLKDIPDGDITITVWHPQLLLTKGERLQSWQLSLSGNAKTTVQVSGTLGDVPSQVGPQDIDFLGAY